MNRMPEDYGNFIGRMIGILIGLALCFLGPMMEALEYIRIAYRYPVSSGLIVDRFHYHSRCVGAHARRILLQLLQNEPDIMPVQ